MRIFVLRLAGVELWNIWEHSRTRTGRRNVSDEETPIQNNFLELTIGNEKRLFPFNTKDAALAWSATEADFWNWLTEKRHSVKSLDKAWTRIYERTAKAANSLSGLMMGDIDTAKSRIEEMYLRGGVIYSKSDDGEFVENIRITINEDAAIGALCVITGAPDFSSGFSNHNIIRGIWEAHAYRHRFNPPPIQFERIMAELSEQREHFNELELTKRSTIDARDKAVSDVNMKLSDVDQELTKKYEYFEEQMKQIRTEYNDKIPAEAAVIYWKKRQAQYARDESNWGLATAFLTFWFFTDYHG